MLSTKLGACKRPACSRLAVLPVLLGLLAAPAVWGQSEGCHFDAKNHLRSGLWHQWIYWMAPGPAASAALERVLALLNTARRGAGQPRIALETNAPLVFAAYEDVDARGPDGQSLPETGPEGEMFLATFVDVEGGAPAVLFLDDPLRSNAALTARGVPGKPAEFAHSLQLSAEAAGQSTRVHWTATGGAERIVFDAHYSDEAITARKQFPPAGHYLDCPLGRSLDTLFRSRPAQLYTLYERSASRWIDLPQASAEVHLEVHLDDPDLQAMYSDPANRPMKLVELDRVVRFEQVH